MRHGACRSMLIGSMAVVLGLGWAGSALADAWWQYAPSTEGDWFGGSNWNAGAPPTTQDDAYVDNGGIAHIGSGNAGAEDLYVGYSAGGGVSQSAGNMTIGYAIVTYGFKWYIGGDLQLGQAAGSCGWYELSGNASLSAVNLYVGYQGTGDFCQNGGTNTLSQWLWLGGLSSGQGTYELSGNSVLTAPTEYIGLMGPGTFTQGGGTNTVAGPIYIGNMAGITCAYALTAGQVAADTLYVGYDGTATFSHSGGTVEVAGETALGYDAGANGTYALQNGGSLTSGWVYVGYSGTGRFTQTGGTHTVSTHMDLGSTSTGVGTYEMAGGSLTVPTINVGIAGQGIFHWTGGTLDVQDIEIGGKSSRLSVGQTAQFAGKVHANGGAIGVDLGDTLTLLGEFGTTQAGKTITKDGAGTLRIEGPQVFAAGSILSVAEGTVFMDTAAGDAATHNLEIDVGGGGTAALVVFEADEYLSMLHILGGGTARLGNGCHLLVLDALWIDGVGQFQNVTLTGTPEPATLALVAFGGLFALARRKQKRH